MQIRLWARSFQSMHFSDKEQFPKADYDIRFPDLEDVYGFLDRRRLPRRQKAQKPAGLLRELSESL